MFCAELKIQNAHMLFITEKRRVSVGPINQANVDLINVNIGPINQFDASPEREVHLR